MTNTSAEHTPLMQQYFDIKNDYPDTLLFFQVGDFYELFFDDAKTAASFLGIALTARGKNKGEPIPLCGVPLHAKDHYLTKLIKGGFKVAICDQMEEAVPGKVVRRGVTQVLTPGTLTDSKLLDAKSASYLFSFYPGEKQWALLFGELLTAQLWATIIPAQSERLLESELARFFPDEVLVPSIKSAKPFGQFFKKLGYFVTPLEETLSVHDEASRWITQFNETAQRAMQEESLRLALYYFYAYIKKTQQTSLEQFNTLYLYQPDDFLYLDAATQRNLDIISNSHDGSRSHTLFALLDGAATPMGSRMIKKWLQRPLVNKQAIIQRQDAIEHFVSQVVLSQMMHQLLSSLGDVERIVGRIALRRAHSHDYLALMQCLEIVPAIRQQLQQSRNLVLFSVIEKHIADFSSLRNFLESALNTDDAHAWIIRSGFDRQLDHMRELVNNSNQKILQLEQEEQQKTGISSLKVRYNSVQGYYIEVTKANSDLVPAHYIRQQTLVGKERFTTPELQRLEYEIMQARTHIDQREKEVFDGVKNEVMGQINALRKLAHGLAHLDALHGFAKIAYNYGYTRPQLHDSRDIFISAGRHPIVEQHMQTGFVPNDTTLTDEQSLWIVTGPNMGGKSTYLRQVALMSIMAQTGSFVPAKRAELALLDRIFTRIGAGDNLAAGKSTFLVEMEETASICTQATRNSLVILDEVGRGTSTFDGLAIAQAVVEYLHSRIGARCLFATHYHELTALSDQRPGIVSYYAASKKTEHGIVFLYKMSKGVADGSFGIEVARLAELPEGVIQRAREILSELTDLKKMGSMHTQHLDRDGLMGAYEKLLAENNNLKAELTQLRHQEAFLKEVRQLDMDNITPKKAFDVLWGLKQVF